MKIVTDSPIIKALLYLLDNNVRITVSRSIDYEGNQTVTNCNALKMPAHDGKMRLTDVADVEQLFRLVQSIPSPKAEPFKLWLA